jgi:hypothetical protein
MKELSEDELESDKNEDLIDKDSEVKYNLKDSNESDLKDGEAGKTGETEQKEIIKEVIINRLYQKTENELLIKYDCESIINKIADNEEEKNNLKQFVRNILLSCNFSYLIYSSNKFIGYFKSLFFYNIFYFIIVGYLFSFITKTKKKEEEEEEEINVSVIKKLLLFNIPEILLIYFYRKKELAKINKSLLFLYSYLNERICYIFNNDPKNKYISIINQNTYDILLKRKDEENKNDKNLYVHNTELLSKETFFDSVISYPNENFGDFDFNNLKENEELMFQEIFTLINEVEKKIKDENSFTNSISSLISNLSFTNAIKFNILYSLGCKLGGFLIRDIYLQNYVFISERKKLIEEKTKDFNQKHMKEGYFLAINDYVILLFVIKEQYKSYDESYNILNEESQNLLKKYFKNE